MMISFDYSPLGTTDIVTQTYYRSIEFVEEVKEIVHEHDKKIGVYLLCFETNKTPYEVEIYITEEPDEVIRQCKNWDYPNEEQGVYLNESSDYLEAYEIAKIIKEDSLFTNLDKMLPIIDIYSN